MGSLPALEALLAAALFGVSTPIAKVLVGEIEPVLLAALLYSGCGLGLASLKALNLSGFRRARWAETRVGKADLPWLIGAIAAGGIGAPILLLFGLESTPASTAALLLNFEAVATALIAALIFKEAIGLEIWLGMALISYQGVRFSHFSPIPMIGGSRRVQSPPLEEAFGALLLGAVSYGLSLVLFGESLTTAFIASLPLMMVGAGLILRERHAHLHTHERIAHDQRHEHGHPEGLTPGRVHSHFHTHPPLQHSHRHVPDIHHRHGH